MRKPLLISVLVICILGLLINLSKLVFGSMEIGVLGFIILAMIPYLVLATLSYWTNSLWITISTGVMILPLDIAQHLYVFHYAVDAQAALLLIFTPVYFLIICVGSFVVQGIVKKILFIIKNKKFFDQDSKLTIKNVFLFFVLPLTSIFILANAGYLLINYNFITEPPLHKAINYQNMEEFNKLLSKGVDIEELNYSKQTPLEAATGINSYEMVKKLVKAGAKINYLNPETNQTPLMWAAYIGNKDSARALLESGADVKLKNNINQDSAIIIARDKDIVEMLIKYGANINDKDAVGQTGLHKVAMYNNAEATKIFLEAGADIEAKDQNGYTPLHEAVSLNNIEVIKILLEHEADISAKNNNGETPEDIALQKNLIEAVKMIKSYNLPKK